jgi:hypothetical protein
LDTGFFFTYPAARHFMIFHLLDPKARQVVNNRKQLAWIIVAGSILLAGCKGGTLPVGSIKTGGPSGGGMLDAAKLCDDYKAGESTADGHYKGKEIEIKGTIRSVRDDKASGKKYLDIKGSEGGGGRSVRCDFAGDQDQIAKMKGGDEVKLQGTCKGKQGTGDNFTVHLENCKLK